MPLTTLTMHLRLSCFPVLILATLLAGAPAAAAVPTTAPPAALRLLVTEHSESGTRHSLDRSTVAQLRGRDRARLVEFPLGGRLVEIDLERFDVVAPSARFVLGRDRRSAGFDPASVALYRGTVAGHDSSRVFLALSARGAVGQFELPEGRWVLGPRDSARRGMTGDDLAVLEANGFGAPPLVDPCLVLEGAAAEGGVASGVPFDAAHRRRVDLAFDSDYEYFSLFGDVQAANEYAVALAGAISALYRRELEIAVALTFVRVWETPDDLFNEPNPLGPFVDHWNATMGDVERDVAQLLTGRRNLPYGGVAYLSALCGGFGYSVAGYLNGSFVSTDSGDPGNWDLIVAAHELGHNCGTLHTHDYGLDECASGVPRRAGLMSYCHTASGGVSNVDMGFETLLRDIVHTVVDRSPCVEIDCDGNGISDAADITAGTLMDVNRDGVPDSCQDCDGDGTLDGEEIARGGALDLDGNGVPDGCEPDCNANGRPDALDIQDGTSIDQFLDGVPDECEPDCDRDGTSDVTQINADMTLDVDRNRMLDACQDCDGDGVEDLVQLQGGLDLWVAGAAPALVQIHGRSGAPTGFLGDYGGDAVSDMAQLPDGRLVVALTATSELRTVDPVSGAALGIFVPTGNGGLATPGALLLLPPDRLLVASGGNNRVIEYSAVTGAFVRVLVGGGIGGPAVVAPWGLALAADGSLLVTSQGAQQTASIRRFDANSGAFLGELVPAGSGGLATPRGLFVLDDGSVLAAAGPSGLLRYDGSSGAFLGRWDKGGVVTGFWGLRKPWVMRRAADGARLLVSNGEGSAAIHSYDLATGLFLRSFYVLSADIPVASGFVELPPSAADCNLNLVLDACDIAQGRSADLNRNRLPDECEGLPGPDIDGDGNVGSSDLGLLLALWGACPAPCPADFNGDGAVDGSDLGVLLGAWG